MLRVTQIQSLMARLGLDAVLLRLPENILLATGWFAISPGITMAVIPPSGQAVLVVPGQDADEASSKWAGPIQAIEVDWNSTKPLGAVLEERLSSLAADFDAIGGTIGYEGSFEQIAPGSFFGEPNTVGEPTKDLIRTVFSTEKLIDVSRELEEIRSVKTELELELIQRTNEVAMMGLRAFKEAAVPGASEVEIMARVEHAIAIEGHGYKGSRWVKGYATVSSGRNLIDGWMFFRSSTRVVEKNDLVMIELGTVADGYWSDHTRTVAAGRSTSQQKEAHQTIMRAVAAALDAARPGSTGGDVDAAARASCARDGLTQFPHHTGHGVGFRYHESLPSLVARSQHSLLAGQVIAVEPGIYGEELGSGVRHEDNAVVTEDGAQVLATTSYELDLN